MTFEVKLAASEDLSIHTHQALVTSTMCNLSLNEHVHLSMGGEMCIKRQEKQFQQFQYDSFW